MLLKNYLKESNQITLVGPLFDSNQELSGKQIFVDGGSHFYKGEGLKIGDGDSSNEKMDIELDKKKIFSDLEYVLSELPQSIENVFAYGFLGGRKDHEYINFGELFKFLNNRKAKVVLSNELSFYSAGTIQEVINGIFSVLTPYIGKIQISGNCEYSFDGEVKNPYSSQFLSNSGHGLVKIKQTMPIGLYQPVSPI